jgi:hypothetical protein
MNDSFHSSGSSSSFSNLVIMYLFAYEDGTGRVFLNVGI